MSAALLLAAGLALGQPAEGQGGDAPERERLRSSDFREVYRSTPVTDGVARGLEFLRRSQLADGSWLCGWGKNTGVVSLAVMAFLAAGHVPGRGEYGETVERGLEFLLAQGKDGLLIRERDTSHGEMYEHGIATLLLGEVLGMVDETRPGLERLRRAHRRAVDIIIRAQNVPRLDRADFGGWRYTPTATQSDLSVTGWQLLALRAAEDAEVTVPRESIERAVLYVKRCARADGGFAYMATGTHEANISMTGTGVLALQICGDFQSPEARRGGDWLRKHPLEYKGPFFCYGAYYSTQAMFQLGGAYWEAWRRPSQELLLAKQRHDGSWLPPPDETSIIVQLGPVYTTAMVILSLTVEYKYLPIYQR